MIRHFKSFLYGLNRKIVELCLKYGTGIKYITFYMIFVRLSQPNFYGSIIELHLFVVRVISLKLARSLFNTVLIKIYTGTFKDKFNEL